MEKRRQSSTAWKRDPKTGKTSFSYKTITKQKNSKDDFFLSLFYYINRFTCPSRPQSHLLLLFFVCIQNGALSFCIGTNYNPHLSMSYFSHMNWMYKNIVWCILYRSHFFLAFIMCTRAPVIPFVTFNSDIHKIGETRQTVEKKTAIN